MKREKGRHLDPVEQVLTTTLLLMGTASLACSDMIVSLLELPGESEPYVITFGIAVMVAAILTQWNLTRKPPAR